MMDVPPECAQGTSESMVVPTHMRTTNTQGKLWLCPQVGCAHNSDKSKLKQKEYYGCAPTYAQLARKTMVVPARSHKQKKL